MPTVESARSWYPDHDPIHGFEHILRVYRLAERLAESEGADLEIVRAAALLHDAGKSSDPVTTRADSASKRHIHHQNSAQIAAEVLQSESWPGQRIDAVQHCIRAHRFRDETEQPSTIEAKVLFDADKLDAIGAIGVARAVAYAARENQPIYAAPSERFIRTGEKEPEEPHSAYHEYLFKLCKLKERMFTKSGRALAEQRHRFMETFFKQLETEVLGRQ